MIKIANNILMHVGPKLWTKKKKHFIEADYHVYFFMKIRYINKHVFENRIKWEMKIGQAVLKVIMNDNIFTA